MSDKDHMAALALCQAGTAQLINWFRYFWFSNNHPESFPTVVDTIMITSYFGQTATLHRLIYDSEFPGQDALIRALHWAAREGHVECVKMLLEHENIEVQSTAVKGQGPLSVATQFGRLDCVRILLEDLRIDVNAKDTYGNTPLSLAALNNHAEITGLLLTHKDVRPDVLDNFLSSPLHMAVNAKS